jgi:8-oxo-dGTP pyrophosphatase MutT (NUDIX family)
VRYGPVEAIFVPGNTLPPTHLIGNVNIVPFIGENAVVLRVASGHPEIPGGTLEPGEDYLAALRRELREEAGADLLSWTLLGAYRCHSVTGEPYRPHLPHPDFYRVVGYGEIALVGQPTNPVGGEEVVEVSVLPVEAAEQLFRQWQRPDIAALYRLAVKCRQSA